MLNLSRKILVSSINALIEEIKNIQIISPNARFLLGIADQKIPVDLIPLGFLKTSNKIITTGEELALDMKIKKVGATLEIV